MRLDKHGLFTNALTHSSFSIFVGIALLTACGGGAPESQQQNEPTTGTPSSADPDRTRILDTLTALGMDGEELDIDGNVIRVGGDIVLYRDVLLDGGYVPALDAEPGQAPVEKGYKASSLISQTNVKNIKLVFGTGPAEYLCNAGQQCAVSTDMNTAFVISSLWDWSGNNWPTYHNTKISISQSNTGSSITVHAIEAANWPKGSPCAASNTACADFPSNNKPGANIWIRSSFNPFGNANQCEYTLEHLMRVAEHELGHTLGVTHPKAGTLIAGTAACNKATAADCLKPGNAGYATVMTNYALTAYPDCKPVDYYTLRPDDLLVATKLYPNN